MAALYAQIECDLPRDPRMLAAGPLARLLYIQHVLWSRENLTDGAVDRLQVPLVAIDIPAPLRLYAKLTEVGAVEITETGWRVPRRVWRKRNPLAAEVEEARIAKGEGGVLGNHRRHHEAKGERSDKCRYCLGPTDELPIGSGSLPLAKKSESEPEGKTEKSSSSNNFQSQLDPLPTTDDDDVQRAAMVLIAWSIAADNAEPGKRHGYAKAVIDNADADGKFDALRDMHTQRPAATAAELADAFRLGGWEFVPVPDVHDGDCVCEGTRWLPGVDGVVPCLGRPDAVVLELRPS